MAELHCIRRVAWIGFAALTYLGAAHTHARAQECSASWPEVTPVFGAKIRYGDAEQKSDPYIDVLVNGKPAKMLLDTGSNAHVLWDARLLDGGPPKLRETSQTLDAIASATHASEVLLSLVDLTNRQHLQQFYVIDETPLMALGYSGIVSPQFLAQDKVSLIDFKDDCFFVSERFDPGGAGRYLLDALGEIPNAHRVMAVPLGVRGGRVPVVVDSGAFRTTLLESLVLTAPLGPHRTKQLDLLGNVVPHAGRTRLVDLSVNGRKMPLHPVVPVSAISEKGVVTLGAIGMDLLRERVIFHDGDRHRFVFVENGVETESN